VAPVDVFGELYASLYDEMRSSKPYDFECVLIESQFKRYGAEPAPRILDIGCGTGNHAVRLARRGYHVHGIDPSEPMLEIGRQKASAWDVDVEFEVASLEGVGETSAACMARVEGLYDGAIIMSTVLGYVSKNDEIIGGLKALRGLLRDGAVVVADLWWGPAVLVQGPSTRFQEFSQGSDRVMRLAEGSYNSRTQIYRTLISVWVQSGDRIKRMAREDHNIRTFFPEELNLLFESGGYRVEALQSFPDGAEPVDTTTWCVVVTARAV